MKLLQELDRCCSPKWVHKFINVQAGESMILQLYNAVRSGKEESEIVVKLYGPGHFSSHPPFRNLKGRLRVILTQAFMMQELKRGKFDSYEHAYNTGFRQLSIVRLLVTQQAYLAAKEISAHTFEAIKDYEIIPLNQGFTDVLASMYLGLFYDEERFNHYSELNQHYNKAAYDLSLVTDSYRRVRSIKYNLRKNPELASREALRSVEQWEEIRKTYPKASQLQGMLINMEVMGYILRGDYHTAIEVSTKGDAILKQCKGLSPASLSLLAISRVDCTIKLNDFEMGKHQIKSAFELINPDSVNGLWLRRLAVVLGFRTGNYHYVYQQFVQLSWRKVNSLLPVEYIESWLIMEAFLNLLILSGDMTPPEDGPKLRRFRVGAFFNNVLSSSKNKSNANIQLVILRSLLHLIAGKHDKFINQQFALDSYHKRYLKKSSNIRGSIFFRLLLVAIKTNCSRLKSRKKGKKLIAELMNEDDWSRANDTELIPYEVLWDIVLRHLIVHKKEQFLNEAGLISRLVK